MCKGGGDLEVVMKPLLVELGCHSVDLLPKHWLIYFIFFFSDNITSPKYIGFQIGMWKEYINTK